MTDEVERLRRAIDCAIGGGPHDEFTASDVARAIAEEFKLTAADYCLTDEPLIRAIYKLAEGK